MAISKIISESLDLTDNYAFTGTITGAGESNIPAFYAFASSDTTSLPQDTELKVVCDTELFDTHSAFDSTTNYRFTVPTGHAGKYVFFTSLRADNLNSGGYARVRLYLNGSEDFSTETRVYSSGNSDLLYKTVNVLNLSEGDYIEYYIRSNNITSGTYSGGATKGASETWFSGFKLTS